MNVWLWGPPLWDVLQSSAFLCDENGLKGQNLVEPLMRLLPCIYCRRSFVDFYATLGPPKDRGCASWVTKVHGLVNFKLNAQKAEATGLGQEFVRDASKLISEPSFEVLRKRFIINREEPIIKRHLLTALIAIIMALELKNNNEDLESLNVFLRTLRAVITVARQENTSELLKILDDLDPFKGPSQMRQSLEFYKYYNNSEDLRVVKDARQATDLIKAGACIAGTCA